MALLASNGKGSRVMLQGSVLDIIIYLIYRPTMVSIINMGSLNYYAETLEFVPHTN